MKAQPRQSRGRTILKWIVLPVITACLLFVLDRLFLEGLRIMGYAKPLWALLAAGFFSMLLPLSALRRKKHDFQGAEHGSARWAKFSELRPLVDPQPQQNMLYSRHVSLSMNTRRTHLGRHSLVFGGTGSGKSRYYIKPNILQMNASYVVTDPKGEHLKSEGQMLVENGYRVKVFDVVHPERSMRFNPFAYFHDVKDIRRCVSMLLDNTSGDSGDSRHEDDFWAKSERLWLMATFCYIDETCLPEEKNLNSVMMMLENSQVKEEDEDFKSPVDILFEDLAQKNSQSFAVKQYITYKLAAGKTAKSILISIGVRLSDFDIPEISQLISEDELELDKVGDEKTALFLIIGDMDTTYNYLSAMLLDVMFNVSVRKADDLPGECLPLPVACYLDELPNLGRFKRLHTQIAVLRSRGISLHLVFQGLSQLKAVYKDNWATLESNCDTTLFLGGKGEDQQKYVADVMIGKTTITSTNEGGGGSGGTLGPNNYNYSEQKTARSLIDENEVSKLDRAECIVNIRGLQPFRDTKYPTEKHPNYRLLADADPSRTYRYERTSLCKQAVYVTEIQIQEVV